MPTTASTPGAGVYDPNQWAVVFKYSSVIVDGVYTVTFKNHPSHAPVVWLVSGDVTLAGEVNLDGQPWVYAPALAEPGPGGFRGRFGSLRFGSGSLAWVWAGRRPNRPSQWL